MSDHYERPLVPASSSRSLLIGHFSGAAEDLAVQDKGDDELFVVDSTSEDPHDSITDKAQDTSKEGYHGHLSGGTQGLAGQNEDDRKSHFPSERELSSPRTRMVNGDQAQVAAQDMAEEDNTSVLNIIDHFLLSSPSSTIHLHNEQTHVFTDGTHQIILQKDAESNSYHAKQVEEGNAALFLIRLTYTIIAVLMSGFLFMFCVQIILFLFLGLLIDTGLTESQSEFLFIGFFGTLLAVPLMLFGLANAMVLALAFTIDCCRGQTFLKSIISYDNVMVEWVTFMVFVGIPVLSMCGSLYAETEYWWEITLLTSFTCVFLYYLLFAAMSILFEVRGCLDLESGDQCDWEKLKRVTLMIQVQRLSGYRIAEYVIFNTQDHLPQVETYSELLQTLSEHPKSQIGLWARITKLLARCNLYEKLTKDNQKRQWTIDEVLGNNPFVTNNSWGLEKIFAEIEILGSSQSLRGNRK